MGKAPANQFYWNDWLGDVELQMASACSRGVWINALARMWYSKIKGELQGTDVSLAKICNCTMEEFNTFLSEAKTLGFCYTSHESNGSITLRNRRMFREEKDRENNRLRQQKYYEKHKSNGNNNGKITPPSSSSSSSSSSKIDNPTDYPSSSEDAKGPDCPHEKIVETYHRILPECPRVVVWNDAQKSLLRTRWREHLDRQNVGWWEQLFQHIRGSPFLMGQKKEFIVDLEWIVRPKNFAKIMNGRYHQGAKNDDERWNF